MLCAGVQHAPAELWNAAVQANWAGVHSGAVSCIQVACMCASRSLTHCLDGGCQVAVQVII